MTYETLDSIADSYIPILAVFLVISIGMKTVVAQRFFDYVLVLFRRDTSKNSREEIHIIKKYQSVLSSLAMLLGVIGVYAIGFFDKRIDFWPRFSLDYSTHTALALVLVVNIVLQVDKAARWFFVLSFIAYLMLMHYQRYHTVLDMLSTTLVISLMLLLIGSWQSAIQDRFLSATKQIHSS